MKRFELPGLILACSVLLSYVVGLTLIQGAVSVAFVGAVYWSARRGISNESKTE